MATAKRERKLIEVKVSFLIRQRLDYNSESLWAPDGIWIPQTDYNCIITNSNLNYLIFVISKFTAPIIFQ